MLGVGYFLFLAVDNRLGGFLTGVIRYRTLYYLDPGDYRGIETYPEGYIADNAYNIDPETILVDLGDAKKNVFIPIHGEPNVQVTIAPDSTPSGTYPWKQLDYVLVAEAVHQLNKNESLKGWQLYWMEFGISDCHDRPGGFDYAGFIFYKDDMTTHNVSAIHIHPLYQIVQWGEATYPRYEKWHSSGPDTINLTAEDALQIAEENGGKQVRRREGNHCSLAITLGSYGSATGWSVEYWPKTEGKYGAIFAIDIDASTGEFKVSK